MNERDALMQAVTDAAVRRAKEVGRRVKEMREAMELKQCRLAARAGLAGAHVSQIENGAMLPGTETLVRLAMGLGCSTDELLGLVELRLTGEGEENE